MSESALKASHRRAILRRGVDVTFIRETGYAPEVQRTAKTVRACVMGNTPAPGESYSGPGEITQGVRRILVMSDDLEAEGFPLPVEKNDRVKISGTDAELDVIDVDDATRRLAGAIQIDAKGVS